MGLKTVSEQFRENLLKSNLQTPPEVVVGLSDLGGSLYYSAFKEDRGEDGVVHNQTVQDPGNVQELSYDIRKYLFKRNLQTPSDIEKAVIDLSANQAETVRNLGSIGTDTTINWRSVVVDTGTVDNAAMVTRSNNLSRNKEHEPTDPSETDQYVEGDSYNFHSLIQTINHPAVINDFKIPNIQSISDKDNPISEDAEKLHLKTNKYIPDEYQTASIRDKILQSIYEKTTYVKDNTTKLQYFNPGDYSYRNFYNLNTQATLATVLNNEQYVIEDDTLLMNIGAIMLQYNLRERFEQNLYTETLGRINIVNYNPNGTMDAELDPLELIKTAKDPLNNLVTKNFTITSPRNFIGKTAQFLLGLEGIVSPFDLWESVHVSGRDLTPSTIPNIEVPRDAIGEPPINTKDDEDLLRKTGGGQRWALYENLEMNKYSPSYETRAELIGFQKPPKGIYYLGSETSPPIDILQAQDVNVISNEKLTETFDPLDTNEDVVWSNMYDDSALEDSANEGEYLAFIASRVAERKSYGLQFREGSLMDVTQRLMNIAGQHSPIRNLKTIFNDGNTVYSKGSAVKKIDMITTETGHKYNVLTPADDGYARTWTKGKEYSQISHLVRYGELIRRERNSVVDRNANYNIFPSKLNVGSIYDQNMLGKDGIKERFADKNFDKVRARKYMFSIENLAWKDSDKFEKLPAFEQGSNGGRVMWFPPYGITFNEQSNADWATHKILGRPEPIYTYNTTERRGTLGFQVIVDHPSILNLLVQKELDNLTEDQVDDILNSFFAGVQEYDIFELARIWGVFSNEDINFFNDVLSGKYEYPANITWNKKVDFNYKVSQKTETVTEDGDAKIIQNKLNEVKLFFPNNTPASGDESYDNIYSDYLKLLSGTTESTDICTLDYNNSIGKDAPIKYFLDDDWTNIKTKFSSTKTALEELKDYVLRLKDDDENMLEIQINAYASPLASEEYNQELAKKRGYSVLNWIKAYLGLEIKNEIKNDATSFDVELIESQNTTRTVIHVLGNYEGGNFNEVSVDKMYIDCGWGVNGFNEDRTINITGREETEQKPESEDDFTTSGCEYKDFSILSYPASYARRVELKASIVPRPKSEITDDLEQTSKILTEPIETDARVNEYSTFINKRDIATRILNKLITENEYFDYLNEASPTVFTSMKEKLKYFSPSFHSMTPEGLNSRLTFLQQCVRPGDTIKTNIGETNTVTNLTFGKPPVCVLRLGDFFNTKIIIENITIDYSSMGNSITYDLNPEGIGVQPMIAKVDMTIKILGGAGLREPVRELQNALSFNYYANADIYESKSFGQTNTDERYLENLELAYDSTELDIKGLNLQDLEKINPVTQTNFNQLGELSTTWNYSTIFSDDPQYNPEHKVKDGSTGLSVVQYYDMDYSKLFSSMYENYVVYMNNYFTTLKDIATDTEAYDLTWLMSVGIFGSSNFGQDGNYNIATYPDMSNWSTEKNYFSFGYDAYHKSNNYARPPVHLYPQQENDRILPVSVYGIDNFAGVITPQYFDVDFITNTMTIIKNGYKKHLLCEEWLLFKDSVYSKFNLLSPDIKQTFRDTIVNMFDEYYIDKVDGKLGNIEENFYSYNKFYEKSLAVNCICNGLDGGTSESGIRYLEVVPNINTSDTNITPDLKIFGNDITSISGEDPLNAFPIPISFASGTMSSYNTVKTLDDDNERGYFNYLRTQIGETNSSMVDNSLPYFDFNDNQWEKDGEAITDVEMKTIYEKLNYEFLYFANLTSDVFMNDTFSESAKQLGTNLIDVDISTYSDYRKNYVREILGFSGDIYVDAEYQYDGDDSELKDVLIPDLHGLGVKDIFFFDFVLGLRTSGRLSLIKENLLAVAGTDTGKKVNIVKFINEINSQSTVQYINTIKTKIDKVIARYGALITATETTIQPTMDMIQRQSIDATSDGYTIKTFEVDSTRANTWGKTSLKNYYDFVADYSWENMYENIAINIALSTLP